VRELDTVSGLKGTQQELRDRQDVSCFGAVTEREAALNDFRAVSTDLDFHATIMQTGVFLLQ